MTRYLKETQKEQVRSLWEECFPDDSESFNDYYFQEKVKTNQILVHEEDGEITAMLHRNPYELKVLEHLWKIDYIVGVATLPKWRKKGHMGQLLSHTMRDMYQEAMPFCFLMPAAEKIYTPYQFTYIYNHTPMIKPKGGQQLQPQVCQEEDYTLTAQAVNQILEERYNVYSVRDESYMKQLQMEVQSDGGELYSLFEKEDIKGVFAKTKEGQRALICKEEISQVGETKPAIMGRIIHMENFLSSLRLKQDAAIEQMSLKLEVEDLFLPENTGTFLWSIEKHGAKLERISPGLKRESVKGVPVICGTIAQLTSWIFGYEFLPILQSVELPDRVFLDEIV